MCSHKADENNPDGIVNLHYQTVMIAFYIKGHPVVPKDIGASIALFDIVWRIPFRRLGFVVPCP
jgi:hypothetical protein